jgi:hypothetical protein
MMMYNRAIRSLLFFLFFVIVKEDDKLRSLSFSSSKACTGNNDKQCVYSS